MLISALFFFFTTLSRKHISYIWFQILRVWAVKPYSSALNVERIQLWCYLRDKWQQFPWENTELDFSKWFHFSETKKSLSQSEKPHCKQVKYSPDHCNPLIVLALTSAVGTDMWSPQHILHVCFCHEDTPEKGEFSLMFHSSLAIPSLECWVNFRNVKWKWC